MANTQPSQSNPVDLTSKEESQLHLNNHSVGEGTTVITGATQLTYTSGQLHHLISYFLLQKE